MKRKPSVSQPVSPDETFLARVRRFASRQALALCFCLSFLLVLFMTGSNLLLLFRQGVIWYISSKAEHVTGLAPISRVEHYVEENGLDQLTAEPQEGFPGWLAYAPRTSDCITKIRLTVFKDTGCVTFYPRVFGADTRIDIFEFRDDLKVPVYTLLGEDNSWSPIGLHATVNLGCSLGCESTSDSRFEIVMYGKKVQLWTKANSLVF